MKKINLFNRNTNSPSYRRMPVSSGFNRGGGIPFPWERGPAEQPGGMGITPSPSGATPSWKEGEHKVPSYRGTGPRKNVPSFRGNAESPRCCRELVCGKTDEIPLFSGMTVRICGMIIAIAALFATPSFAEPTELDKKTVASKAYVDTKQDIIETDQVVLQEGLGGDPDVHVPALVSFGTPDDNNGTDGLLGNKVGILGFDTIDTMGLTLFDFSDNTEVMGLGNMDSFVPTVRVVANELSLVQGSILDILEEVNAIYATLPTGTAGTVVTYNGTNAQTGVQEFGETPIYSGPTAQTPYNESTDATKLATAGFVETKQNKMVCAGWDSDTHTDEHCWLWSIE